MQITGATFGSAPQAMSPARRQPLRFGGDNVDRLRENVQTPLVQTINDQSKPAFDDKLDQLVSKIRAGDYEVLPASGRRWHRNFKHGFKIWKSFLDKGEVIIRPRPGMESSIRQVDVSVKDKSDRISLTVEMTLTNGNRIRHILNNEYYKQVQSEDYAIGRFLKCIGEYIAQAKDGKRPAYNHNLLDDVKI